MVNHPPDKKLEIKKAQLWELWLVSPSIKTCLAAFKTLEELNQAQITLYHCWEKAYFTQELHLAGLRH